ncbi:hypothetical protein Tco_0986167 [Tanacetum coccineum]
MSLANQKATTEYQEAIQATEDLESPAVGFAKTSDYKGGLTNQVNANSFEKEVKEMTSRRPSTLTEVLTQTTNRTSTKKTKSVAIDKWPGTDIKWLEQQEEYLEEVITIELLKQL